jgi:hypothetical protein
MMAHTKWIAPAGLVCGLLSSSHSFAAALTGTMASPFCMKIQSMLQPFLKIPLSLFCAEDGTTDDMHTGESQYVHCQFRQKDNSIIDIDLHDDSDGLFDDATKNGYAALSGYGDKGRYTTRGSAGQKWLDVVRCKVLIHLTMRRRIQSQDCRSIRQPTRALISGTNRPRSQFQQFATVKRTPTFTRYIHPSTRRLLGTEITILAMLHEKIVCS